MAKIYTDIPVMLSDVAALGWQVSALWRSNGAWIARAWPVGGPAKFVEGVGSSILEAIEDCWRKICLE